MYIPIAVYILRRLNAHLPICCVFTETSVCVFTETLYMHLLRLYLLRHSVRVVTDTLYLLRHLCVYLSMDVYLLRHPICVFTETSVYLPIAVYLLRHLYAYLPIAVYLLRHRICVFTETLCIY